MNWKQFWDMFSNFEIKLVRISQVIHRFITKFFDIWQQFTEGCCCVTTGLKIEKNCFIINETWKLISINH